MEAALCNAAADATDVTGSQSVQDGSRIKHNRYAFRELAPCAAIRPDLRQRSAHSNCHSRCCLCRQYLHADDENVTGVFKIGFRGLAATTRHHAAPRNLQARGVTRMRRCAEVIARIAAIWMDIARIVGGPFRRCAETWRSTAAGRSAGSDSRRRIRYNSS
jgi:hypothetical protein